MGVSILRDNYLSAQCCVYHRERTFRLKIEETYLKTFWRVVLPKSDGLNIILFGVWMDAFRLQCFQRSHYLLILMTKCEMGV
jgi:hypothetical protein